MQKEEKAAGEAVLQTVVELADFLNREADFAITEPEIQNCLSAYQKSGLNIADEKDCGYIFRTAFCKNKYQYISFPDYFKGFLQRKQYQKVHAKQYEDLKKKKNSLSDMQEQYRKSVADIQAQNKQLNIEKEEKLQKVRENEGTETQQQGENIQQKLTKFCKNESFASTLLQKAGKGEPLAYQDTTEASIQTAQKEVLAKAEEAMLAGDLKRFQNCQRIMHTLKLLQSFESAKSKGISSQVEKIENEYARKQQANLLQIKRKEKEVAEIQNAIDRITKSLLPENERLTLKTGSVIHRDIFQSNGGAVQIIGDKNAPECADKAFNQLTDKEKQIIQQYLKENILSFKTRLTRHLDEMDRSSIDMGETIKNACRTGGIPMVLHYNKPKPGRADLMLVLDVSGSCRKASEMMLTFMYMLKAAFPHGCSAFAFVNSLYDISGLMDVRDGNIDQAIEKIMRTIPTRGVYSDYSVPIRTLKEKYSPKITKDTILIFMGDARNNKNDPCYNELKYLCRKAKRAYWLNTETADKWDTADSIAYGYGKLSQMTEVVNVAELINFIRNGIR